MAFDYTGLRDETAEPLIKEFGKTGGLLVNDPATGLYNVVNGANNVINVLNNVVNGVSSREPYESQFDSETSHAIIAVQTQFKKSDNNGTLVEMGDVLFLVSTEGVTIDPALANRITMNSITYQVVRIDPLEPGPVVMLWKIHARK